MAKFKVRVFERVSFLAECEAIMEADSADAAREMIVEAYKENPWVYHTLEQVNARNIIQHDDAVDDLELLPDRIEIAAL